MLPLVYKKGVVEKENIAFEHDGFPISFIVGKSDKSGLGFVPHIHDAFEILYIECGTAEIHIEDKGFNAREGDIYIVNCGEFHSCFKACRDFRSKCIQFNSQFLSSNLADICQINFISPIFNNLIRFQNHFSNNVILLTAIKEVFGEFQKKEYGYEFNIKSIIYRIMGYLLRHGVKINLTENKDFSSINLNRVNYIINYIEQNYEKDIRLSKFEKELYINKSYICRIFKAYTGKSILSYVNMYRTLQAVNMLNDVSLSIANIAEKTGFIDINYFCRIFKKNTGISPSSMRKHSQKLSADKIKLGVKVI